MKVSVFGLGYVGVVTAACIAELGHDVIGVDVDEFKVDAVNKGTSPIVEELIGDLIEEMVDKERVHATTDTQTAVRDTEVSFVCVGTPSNAGGGVDLSYIQRVAEQIAAAIRSKTTYHLVVVRSTIPPGTMDDVVKPMLHRGVGTEPGTSYGLCFHPEFLREGSSVRDFRNPPKIVIGSTDERAAATLASIYSGFSAPLVHCSMRAAEMIKYADNSFHALKVVFANEIGSLCKRLGIDSHEVMRVFCLDTRLNISPAYLMPGFAYGGSCLPKDLRAVMSLARNHNLDLPLLSSIQTSNENHVLRVINMVIDSGVRSVCLLGLSFKPGTDDLRESPLVELLERLLGKGFDIRVFDENVIISRLRGGNRAFIEQRLPHIAQLLVTDAQEAIESAQAVIIGTNDPAFVAAIESTGEPKVIFDLVRLFKNPPARHSYHGVCW
jgi:GDP-mannose 6-dehydrogenase